MLHCLFCCCVEVQWAKTSALCGISSSICHNSRFVSSGTALFICAFLLLPGALGLVLSFVHRTFVNAASFHSCCPAVLFCCVWVSGALGLDLSFVRHIFLMEPLADAALEQQVGLVAGHIVTLLHWCICCHTVHT